MPLINHSTFHGTATIKQHEGKYLHPAWGGGFLGPIGNTLSVIDYSNQSYEWEIVPSHRGGSFIRCPGPGVVSDSNKVYWQTNLKDQKKIKLHPGADDWETYFFEPHPSGGAAIKSMGSNQWVCAEPSSHGVHMIANRDQVQQWERFQIEFKEKDITVPKPVKTGPQPFYCSNCNKVLGQCGGEYPGARCIFYDSRPRLGGFFCPYCKKEFAYIDHIHR